MKFFTLEAYNSEDDDGMQSVESWRSCYEGYQDHVLKMRGALPDSVLEISGQDVFDDGLVTRVRHDREKQALELRLRCGNLQIGYYNMLLTYSAARISVEHDRVLATIARTTTGSHGYSFDCHNTEVDVNADGEIVHRFMFNPGVWFEIACASLVWKKVPKPGRRFAYAADRYLGGPEVDDGLVAWVNSLWIRSPDEETEA